MNKLVIHPKDRTTDFLKPIYHGRNDTTVITGGCTKKDVEQAIKQHDHIIMMGHGTPQGLLSMNQFNGKPKKTAYVTPSQLSKLPKKNDGIKTYSSYQALPGYNTIDDDLGYYSGNNGYVIDDMSTELLEGKKLTAIWCNADQYMEWNELEGFYTGMFISDEGEAKMIGTADTEKWQVEESNYAFVSIVRRYIDHSSEKLRAALMLEYGEMAERNAVAKYNLHRFYTRSNASESLRAI
jgi:hypothetical protein